MVNRNSREDRNRKKFALPKTILNARRQRQLMQQSILNHFIARRRLILNALLLSSGFPLTKARKMSARSPSLLNCFIFLARPLRVFLFSLFWAALRVITFLFGVSFSIISQCTVSSSSENSEVEIVYGLELLWHFAAILSKPSSQSPPRSATTCAVSHSRVKTLKHIYFRNLWIEFGTAIARRLKPSRVTAVWHGRPCRV